MQGFKEAAIKSAIVLIPSYTAAYLTGQMVYVVPTLAAAGFFASSITVGERQVTRQLDEDAADDGDGFEGADSAFASSEGD